MRLVFFGSPPFAVPSLERLAALHEIGAVVTQPDRPSGRGRRLTPPAVKAAAQRLGLPILQPEGLRSPELDERMRALAPDVFVVVAYGRILPQALLDVPRLGPWNVHASLLPRLRGAAPIQWAIIRGESATGVSIMRMEAGIDTGPVAARIDSSITEDDTAASLSERLATMGAELLFDTLPSIEAGTVRLEPQDDASATMAPILRKEDGHLDFRWPAPEVAARTRGVDPWPGAYAHVKPSLTAATAGTQSDPKQSGADVVRLFRPRIVPARGEPGEVLALDRSGLLVACAVDGVAFGELQLPGGRRLPAAAAEAGRRIRVGARLGS